jgi:B12-binding domain/radical SAM domain protein
MMMDQLNKSHPEEHAKVAVAFLASDVNRFSINALTGAIEQDPDLHVKLAFPHPRSVQLCYAEIEQLIQSVGPSGTVVVAFSFMSSALVTTAHLLKHLQDAMVNQRHQLLFVAGGPHASGDAVGTLAMGFDIVFIGEGEYSFSQFLHRLADGRREFQDIRGLAYLAEDSAGNQRVLRTGRPPLIALNARYPSIGVKHRRLGAIEIGRGCPHACGFCQTPFLHGARMRYRALDSTLEHIEQLVKAGFKDIRFITPDALAYLSDDGVHPRYTRLEEALIAMHKVAGEAKLKFGEFPSEMRPEYITPEIAQLIDRYSDAAYIAIGAQSGSEAMLQAMHREHDVAAVERAVFYLAKYCRKLKKIYVDFIAGLPKETPQDEALSQQLMERLTRISSKVCIHSHTFMPLPGTPMQYMPPGSVGKTTRATFEKLSKRGQEWGDWQAQEEIAHSISEIRRELRGKALPMHRNGG